MDIKHPVTTKQLSREEIEHYDDDDAIEPEEYLERSSANDMLVDYYSGHITDKQGKSIIRLF